MKAIPENQLHDFLIDSDVLARNISAVGTGGAGGMCPPPTFLEIVFCNLRK